MYVRRTIKKILGKLIYLRIKMKEYVNHLFRYCDKEKENAKERERERELYGKAKLFYLEFVTINDSGRGIYIYIYIGSYITWKRISSLFSYKSLYTQVSAFT